MTDSDFQSITEGLCNSDGQLGPVEFEAVMKRQIKQVTQAKLALVGGIRSAEDLEFMQFGALKMVLLEQVGLS
jgi:phosphoribosylformimino-5-aminoimidazole carboxamide ribonucleotide (ProFAR) isomerase